MGPSTANSPDGPTGLDFWTAWANHTTATSTVPDILSFHLLDAGATLRAALETVASLRTDYGISDALPVVVNEYGALVGEQVPSGAAWYIGQFERHGVQGLRANWAGGVNGSELHDFLANLLFKTQVDDSSEYDYYPTSEWPVYNYYATQMTGQRVATSSSADDVFEVFATSGDTLDSVKILAAVRPVAGAGLTYDLTVTGLSSLGATNGSVNVQTYRFNGAGWRQEVGGPDDLGIVTHGVSNDSVRFVVFSFCCFAVSPHSPPPPQKGAGGGRRGGGETLPVTFFHFGFWDHANTTLSKTDHILGHPRYQRYCLRL